MATLSTRDAWISPKPLRRPRPDLHPQIGPAALVPSPVVPGREVAPVAPDVQGAPRPAAPPTLGPHPTAAGVVFNFNPHVRYRKVFLSGTFNDWEPRDPAYLLKDEDGDGVWNLTVKLAPGIYQYKFVVDGYWIKDPDSPGWAPDGFGGQNGKLEVK
jgi:hypothetical protein